MGRLALVADTHTYQDGLPSLFRFFERHGILRLACLGDCPPEPFRPWLANNPQHQLYWVYDFTTDDFDTLRAELMAVGALSYVWVSLGELANDVQLTLLKCCC